MNLTFLRTILGVGIVLGMFATVYFARIMRVPHLFATAFIVLCLTLVTAPLCKTISNAWMWLIPIGIADAIVLVMLDTICIDAMCPGNHEVDYGVPQLATVKQMVRFPIVCANINVYINKSDYGSVKATACLYLNNLIKIIDPDNTGKIRFEGYKKLMLLAIEKSKEKGHLKYLFAFV